MDSRIHRARRWAITAAVPTGLLVSGLLVWNSSQAAFTATTDNAGNSWATGTMALSDDDSGAALFQSTGLYPGATAVEKCIKVTYTGTLAPTAKFYVTGVTSTGNADPVANPLESQLDVTITSGSGTVGASGACTTFTPASAPNDVFSGTLGALKTSSGYATNPIDPKWSPTSVQNTKVYKITAAVKSTAGDGYQGATATARFVWETRMP